MTDSRPTKITVVDYGMGNLRSVAKILSRIGTDVRVSSEPSDLEWCDRMVLPGVGAFPDAMRQLNELGLRAPLDEMVRGRGKPLLGICLGMELLARESQEVRRTEGLGWLDAEVVPFDRSNGLRVPHVGWNQLKFRRSCPLLGGLEDGATCYFVHSYHLSCDSDSLVVATCDYGKTFPAVVRQENVFGTQFHPEKSQANGFQLLVNFVTEPLDKWPS